MGHGEGQEQAWLVYGTVWGELEWAWEATPTWKDVSGGGGWLGHRSACNPLTLALKLDTIQTDILSEF